MNLYFENKLSRVAPACMLALSVLLSGPLQANGESPTFAAVDEVFAQLEYGIENKGLTRVLEIDHARLAENAGQPMPPARVVIFSNPEVSSRLVAENTRAGLDLPMRMLAYESVDGPAVAFTSAEFIARRHALSNSTWLETLDANLQSALEMVKPALVSAVPTAELTAGYGILELVSERDFESTIDSLKNIIMAQGDTVWFGDVDFQAQAADWNIELSPATLLLFGGPGPGGVAMRKYPSIGLDAFCQKLLVYQDSDGAIRVIYNDIAALATLHYGHSAKPHHGLNQRLTATFQRALKAE